MRQDESPDVPQLIGEVAPGSERALEVLLVRERDAVTRAVREEIESLRAEARQVVA